nr:MAG TPA: helix-turn-helix domain protein [Caudoviricetes sp.]
MIENWLALYLAIFKNVNAKQAINYIKYGKRNKAFDKNVQLDRMAVKPKTYKSSYVYLEDPKVIKRKQEREKKTKEQYIEIIELKKNHTFRECGEILGITYSAAFSRYKKAIANAPTKATTAINLNKNTVSL